MKVERRLQVCLATLAVLSTFLLGMGEGKATLPLIMLFAAPISLVFSDRLSWLRLNRYIANAAALASVSYALVDFFQHGAQNQLLAIANLLLYLQLILLFQEKNPRIYWQLLVLSMLQVVVAAAMNLSFHFGVLLFVYELLALVTLSLLFVLRESRRYGAGEATGELRRETSSGEASSVGRAPAAAPHSSTLAAQREEKSAWWSAKPRVWIDTPARDESIAFLRGRGIRPVVQLGFLTLAFTVIVFYASPRAPGTNWQGGRGGRASVVGFSQQVSLNELSEILESDELAMRVSFFDQNTGEPYQILSEPYFRGSVLAHYGESQKGRWTVEPISNHKSLPAPPPDSRSLVRQEISLEPSPDSLLFGIFPSYRVPGTRSDINCNWATGQLLRPATAAWVNQPRWKYELVTTGIEDRRQTIVTPDELIDQPRTKEEMRRMLLPYLQIDRDRFPEICELAQFILSEAKALDADNVQRARWLELHFLQSGLYQYSLRPVRPPRGVDPIEEFIGKHRTGHCEYFATALALMLRSQGIPSRLVVGYHGGEYNAMGNYYLVRQRDAHAWVEAYLTAEEVAILGIPGWPRNNRGAWLRLDPTPGQIENQVPLTGVRRFFEQVLDYAEYIWSDYVVGMNPDRQREAFYDPFFKRLTDEAAKHLDYRFWRRRLAEWLRFVDGGEGAWSEWRRRALIVLSLVALALGIYGYMHRARLLRALQFVARRLRGWLFPRGRAASSVAFYRKLERLLARQGFVRAEHQTPREFLDSVAASLPPATVEAARRVIAAFYRVRYERATLDNQELDEIENAIRTVAEFKA